MVSFMLVLISLVVLVSARRSRLLLIRLVVSGRWRRRRMVLIRLRSLVARYSIVVRRPIVLSVSLIGRLLRMALLRMLESRLALTLRWLGAIRLVI